MSAVDFQQIPYFGGPYDGEQTRMSDGVKLKVVGGYYEPAWVPTQPVQVASMPGKLAGSRRVALWHAIPEEGL